MTNDAKVKKWLSNKVQIQCTGNKMWPHDEGEGGHKIFRSDFRKIKVGAPTVLFGYPKSPLQRLRVYLTGPLNNKLLKSFRSNSKRIWSCNCF